jgi:NADPH:quinone reductase-like Zn-dependent oxidoreductase
MADVPEPVRADGEVVVEVAAYSVNRGETFLLEDPAPGWRPGKDVAGWVAAGDGLAPGTPVVCHVPAFGWAERVVVAAAHAVPLPVAVDVLTAAALPLAGLTAYRLLRKVGALPGRSLLVTGASGGVGHYLTELATAAGARVTAVCASEERGARLRELGADVVTDVDEAPGRYDVVLESVGGDSFVRARRKAGPGGTVIWFGQASRRTVTLDFFDWIDGTVGAPIIPFHYAGTPAQDAHDLASLVRLVSEGHLHPEIGTTGPWTETAQTIEDLRTRRLRGNAVLTLA